MAASAMLCALPDRYYARYRHDPRYRLAHAHASPLQHHGHQRRAAIGCVRIALKWVFDCFSAAQGCRGLDLYLEPTTASWVWHEVDILSHLDWTIGRFFVQTPVPTRSLSSTSSSTSTTTPFPSTLPAHNTSQLARLGSAAVAPNAVARTMSVVGACERRPLATVTQPHPSGPTRASRGHTADKSRSPVQSTPSSATSPGGPATGDHAAVSLIPRRRATRASAPRRPRPAYAVRPITEQPTTTTTTTAQPGHARAPVDARAPPPTASRLAASSESDRSARSRYENRTSAEARSMAPASARSTSASTGSVPRAVIQPLVLHVGM
ncbi:hypothetical protein pmac_cds_230 [Pandoravirus macleodensis]|uniref:Uncharacterized protein n=1 Tax=Pandoravirus macleodensis TaxID=2107707 RepID=A0A2U7UEM7_9VIRU|nr:hypothetical protein pmac_cds_230 [Pandoravirus macleodensis]AVK76918.1 hypothetical protein pmac_cds_230 [Pandoravirus macleodensis]